MDISSENKKVYIKFFIMLVAITLFLKGCGRSIPNKNENDLSSNQNQGFITYLTSASNLSRRVDLGEQNLISGAYAYRTAFALKFNDLDVDLKLMKESKIFHDGNVLNNDNYFYKVGNDIYGIFIVDNKYTKDDILNFKYQNKALESESIINEEELITDSGIKAHEEGYIQEGEMFKYNDTVYLKLYDNQGSSLFAFGSGDSFLSLNDVEPVIRAGVKPASDLFTITALDYENKDYDNRKMIPFKFILSSKGNVSSKDAAIQIKGTNIQF